MQTVKFQCGKCSKIMQVGAELLGKQVRCPHCQQVILAPAQVPAAPVLAGAGAGPGAAGGSPEIVFRVPTPQRGEEEGSIFNEGEEEGDDLFNSPKAPTVELPPSPAAPAPVQATPPAVAPPPPADTEEAAPALDDSPAARARQLARAQSQKESKLTFMLLIVIVPYALIMTIAVIFLVLTRPDPTKMSPYKVLPDPGEQKSPIQKRVDDSRPMPDDLKVALNNTINIGDIEVTPLEVAWKPILYCQESGRAQPEPSRTNALVVKLRVKNTSEKDSFAPNDLFFNRSFGQDSTNKPYTCVEVLDDGKQERFYGGPTKWRPRSGASGLWRGRDPREYIKETEYNRVLQPGESMEMIVCTDPENTNIQRSVSSANDLLWRIQLRRGYYDEEDRRGTVTCLIGVQFKSSDIKKQG